MPRIGYRVMKKCHRELWNKSSDGKIKEDKLDRIIKDVGGFTTKSRYKNELEDRGLINYKDGGVYEVEEPEKEEPNFSGEKASMTVTVDKGLKEQAENLGLNKEEVFNNALIEFIGDRKEFLVKRGFNVDDKEAEVMIRYLEQDIYRENFRSDKEKKRVHKARREIYLDVYDEKDYMRRVEEEDRNDFSHLGELRKKTFKLATDLGYVEKPKKSFRK